MLRHFYYTVITVLLLLTAGLHLSLVYNPAMVSWYSKYLFQPFQIFRQKIFGFTYLSVGDIYYIMLGVSLLVGLIKLIGYVLSFQSKKEKMLGVLRRGYSGIVWLYIIFFIGWGGNYYKPELMQGWSVNTDVTNRAAALYELDSFLVDKMNAYATGEPQTSYDNLERRAKFLYRNYTNSVVAQEGLDSKASLLGERLFYFGIQGYYNPFTGEAQINDRLPQFMKPFVITHEMAHQTGIAREGDANLMAYILSTRTKDTAFCYSAYFNMWLYAHSRLYGVDSVSARRLRDKINPLTVAHIDTLRQLKKKYSSDVRHYSDDMYDKYLKMLQQEEGINSYYKVVLSAYAWEQLPMRVRNRKLDIP